MTTKISADELFSITDQDYGFLDHCGREAREWLAELRQEETLRIMSRTATALEALKRYDVKTGRELLTAVEGDLQARTAGLPSITHLLERYRVSARAYLCYLDGDLEQAKADLLQAHEEVRTIIGLHEFLLPIAIQCVDFVIQRARVARREKQWQEAAGLIRIVHEIFSGLRPLCVLPSGRAVGLPGLRAFFASLPLSEEQRAQADRLMGAHIPVAQRIEYLEEMIFTLPDVVIPYP